MRNKGVKSAPWWPKTFLLLVPWTKVPLWELWDPAPYAKGPERSLAHLCIWYWADDLCSGCGISGEANLPQPLSPWLEKVWRVLTWEYVKRTRGKLQKCQLLEGIGIKEKKKITSHSRVETVRRPLPVLALPQGNTACGWTIRHLCDHLEGWDKEDGRET